MTTTTPSSLPSPAPVLRARDLSLEYHDGRRRIRAVDRVSVELGAGEFVGLIGPSGSGKSSLLFLLGGLRRPDAGEVEWLGHRLPASPDDRATLRRRHVGFLFQEPFLLPYLSVRENALVAALEPAAEEHVEAIAEAIGIADLLDERPHRLSGGERQRAGILRALAGGPALVLADEPTANLDQATGRSVMRLLRERCRDAALLVVTHDAGMLEGADRILHLEDGRLDAATSGPGPAP